MNAGLDRLASGDLAGFAAANGWSFDATAAPPALGSGLWERASSGIVANKISGPGWQVGHLRGGTNRAENVQKRGAWTIRTSVTVSTPQSSIDLGYLAITLPRRLPHLILDGVSNNRGGRSTLLKRPNADQRLSLEGDFDSHFRLYAPRGYERDALYVFTPDLMAMLIDETGDLDVEVRDDQLIIYRPGGFDVNDPATWERFEHIRTTLGSKAWDRTDLYADERVAGPNSLVFDQGALTAHDASGNTVSREGTRLKTRGGIFGSPAAFVGVIFAVFGLITAIGTVVYIAISR